MLKLLRFFVLPIGNSEETMTWVTILSGNAQSWLAVLSFPGLLLESTSSVELPGDWFGSSPEKGEMCSRTSTYCMWRFVHQYALDQKSHSRILTAPVFALED